MMTLSELEASLINKSKFDGFEIIPDDDDDEVDICQLMARNDEVVLEEWRGKKVEISGGKEGEGKVILVVDEDTRIPPQLMREEKGIDGIVKLVPFIKDHFSRDAHLGAVEG